MEATAGAHHSKPSTVSETSDETSILNEYTGDPEKKMNIEGEKKKEGKVYRCNLCKREFDSFQALGGHQNAHKRERSAAQHRNLDSEQLALGYPHAQCCNPYLSTAPWLSSSLKSCNGFFGQSPQYVIYKPYYARSFMGYQSGSHGMINLQPEAKRMRVDEDHDEHVNINVFGEFQANIVSNNSQACLPGGIGHEAEVQELDLSLKL